MRTKFCCDILWLGRLRRGKDYVKMDLKERSCEAGNWMELARIK
jgi:hypothetical protein